MKLIRPIDLRDNRKEYNELTKAKKNNEYVNSLKKSMEQIENGDVVSYSINELKKLVNED